MEHRSWNTCQGLALGNHNHNFYEMVKILTDKVGKASHVTKFLLHQTDQNGLSHVIRPQEVYLLLPTLWLNSVKLKGVFLLVFYNKTCKDK